KELDEENNMYYYSARYYAPPTFISRDPMFEKYPSISPYTYCANNPVGFVDPTGEEVEGFSIDEQGNVQINKDIASKDAVRIYAAMSKTETGKEAFKDMVKKETKITLALTDKAIFDNEGNQIHGNTLGDINDLTSNGEYKNATITISTADVTPNANDRYNGFNDDEKINGIGTHESVHLNSKQIKIDFSNKTLRTKEQKPVMLEYKSRLEYRQKYGKEGDRDINLNYKKYLFKSNFKTIKP
ncbi:MAG: RHS repeat-associated core domain-containing protein, partial [Bacteroidales bacterium]|nr:RHS repeat-associated core domain-containing protein [Bacteroidales bacterium]